MNGRILHLVGTPTAAPPQSAEYPLAFINYRSTDEPWAAMFLRNALTTRFGPHTIFIDHAGIDAGEDFRPALLRAVVRSSALLAVIGHRWLAPTPSGTRPIDNGADWVRKEIALALTTDVPVLPVLVGDAEPPKKHELPRELKPLTYRQYARLRPRDSGRDLEHIADRLEQFITGARTKRPSE